jgi:alpha-ribazole phosphatase
MSLPPAIALLRHTRLSGHEGLCYGRHEVALAKTFEAEAAAVKRHLPWIPREIWTSPALRCRSLAEYLAHGSAEVRCDERLAEMHFGAWEGRRWDELRGPEVDAWMADPWTARPPGGETAVDFAQRVSAFRDELVARRGERVLVITHAGVIRVWWSLEQGTSLAAQFERPVDYGGVYPVNG